MSTEHWFENAVVYALDVDRFQDADGDGVGDFRGLIERLDYLNRLGVSAVWLLPFYRRSRPSASGLDPEGEGRKLRWVLHFRCGWLAFKIIALLHWYWSE